MRWRWMPPDEVATRIARTLLAEPAGPPGEPPRSFRLAAFQEEAVRRARGILARRGGVIVADEVGLGKTYVALALIEEAIQAGDEVVVIVPAALRRTWAPLVRRLTSACGPGAGRMYLTTHTRLSRGSHDAGRLAGAGLVVVDEAHAFRNPATRRYRALAERAPGSRVLLITATPVNNRVEDLYHLIRQFADDDAFRDIGVASLTACFLEPGGGGEDAGRVAREVVVRRTRSAVAGRDEALASDGSRVRFPRRAHAELVRYDDERAAELVTGLERLELAPYQWTGSAPGVEALVRLGLLKRFESGRPALAASLRRLRGLLVRFAGAADRGRLLRPRDTIARGGPGDGDALQLVLDELVLDPASPGVDLERLATSARNDAAAVQRMQRLLAGHDPKLAALREWLGSTTDGDKVLVFTEFRDSAAGLWKALTPLGGVARVDGTGAWLGQHPAGRRAVVERFAPISNGVAPPPGRERVDLLIATDVLSEGLNLQDAAVVVSYDLPWNPVRLLQRIGRVDRLGSLHEVVRPVLFVPGAGLDDVLRLTRSLRAKLGGIAATIGAGDAGELLARLGGGGGGDRDAARALASLAPADPWEDLRAVVRGGAGAVLNGGPPLLGDAGPAAGAGRGAGADAMSSWLVLARTAGRSMALFEVHQHRVRDADHRSAAALQGILSGDPGECAAAPCRALEAGAEAAVRAVRRHMNARDTAGRAPARLARSDPTTRIAAVLRRALNTLGPDPEPALVARADAALERLSRPLSLPERRALKTLLARNAPRRGTGSGGAGRLERLLRVLEDCLPAARGAPPTGPPAPAGRAGKRPRAEILAALRIPPPEGSRRGVSGG